MGAGLGVDDLEVRPRIALDRDRDAAYAHVHDIGLYLRADRAAQKRIGAGLATELGHDLRDIDSLAACIAAQAHDAVHVVDLEARNEGGLVQCGIETDGSDHGHILFHPA